MRQPKSSPDTFTCPGTSIRRSLTLTLICSFVVYEQRHLSDPSGNELQRVAHNGAQNERNERNEGTQKGGTPPQKT